MRQEHITAMIMLSVRIRKVHILVIVILDLKGMVSLVQVQNLINVSLAALDMSHSS